MAPQEPLQGSSLPRSRRGLAPQEQKPRRLLPGETIYDPPIMAACHGAAYPPFTICRTVGSPLTT